MGHFAYKSKVGHTLKLIALTLLGIVIAFILVIYHFLKDYVLALLGWRLDWLTVVIVGGFITLAVVLVLLTISLFIPTQYVLTDDAMLIRRFFVIKYAEHRIPYNQIERVFLFVSWDFRGRERYSILVKLQGEPKVNVVNPTLGTLLYLYLDEFQKFLNDLTTLSNIPCICEKIEIPHVNKIDTFSGQEFSSSLLITGLLILLLILLIMSPALLILVHIYPARQALSSFWSLNFPALLIPAYLTFLSSYLFISSIINLYQRYILAEEGLYIIKLSATIFIPKKLIRGFIYKDYSEKLGVGGGLLIIGGMATIISVKNFKEFLNLMKQYGFVIETPS